MSIEAIEVYISYRWVDDSVKIADAIQSIFSQPQHGFKVMRDNAEVGYKGDLGKYMERLGNAPFVVCIISDGYLKSHHCMRELLLLHQQPDFKACFFPIVLADASIRTPEERLDYQIYWQERKKLLTEQLKRVTDPVGTQDGILDLNLYDQIHDAVTTILKTVDNMNSLSAKAHIDGNFSIIAEHISQQAGKLRAEDDARADKESRIGGRKAPKEELQFACDRKEQVRAILRSRRSDFRLPSFFFLSGNEEQDHVGFLERVKLELEKDWWTRNKQVLQCHPAKVHFPEGDFVNREDLLYEFLGELDKEGWGYPAENDLDKVHFQQLIDQSVDGGHEVILLLVIVRDRDFIRAATLQHISWLCQNFFDQHRFSNPLQEVIVLWGLNYMEASCTERARKLIAQLSASLGDWVIPLPELEAISQEHIDDWFYENLRDLEPAERKALIHKYFGDGIPSDMFSVKKRLARLINDWNLNA